MLQALELSTPCSVFVWIAKRNLEGGETVEQLGLAKVNLMSVDRRGVARRLVVRAFQGKEGA